MRAHAWQCAEYSTIALPQQALRPAAPWDIKRIFRLTLLRRSLMGSMGHALPVPDSVLPNERTSAGSVAKALHP